MMTDKIEKSITCLLSGAYSVTLLLSLFSFSTFADTENQHSENASVDEVAVKPQIGSMDDSITVDQDTFEFSSAERKIWLDDHLSNVNKPIRLYYEFVKEGSYEQGFIDSVYLDVLKVNKDGSKNTSLQFFTAERQQKAGADNLNNIKGNPVIGIYMQGDVMEMNRLTEGSWRYFQRRIKFAISDDAVIEPVSIIFNGEQIKAEKITFKPYLNDPRRSQFEKFAEKRYEFIFSNSVPGALYQISTIVPDSEGTGKEPLLKETLTLQNAEFRS